MYATSFIISVRSISDANNDAIVAVADVILLNAALCFDAFFFCDNNAKMIKSNTLDDAIEHKREIGKFSDL